MQPYNKSQQILKLLCQNSCILHKNTQEYSEYIQTYTSIYLHLCESVCVYIYIYIYIYIASSVMSSSLRSTNYSLPGSSVHWIFQARILELVAISLPRISSQTRDGTHISCIGRWILYHWDSREGHYLPYYLIL